MIEVCKLEDLRDGESMRVAIVPPVALFNIDGTFMAIDDTCSHQDASLAEGWVEGCLVECPLHFSRFDLRTGVPDSLPATEPVRVHRVVIENGLVYLDLSAHDLSPNPATALGGRHV
jgi:3-phenylpropionate/trans-cinnamate dioxygenase ferredoxin subunit